MRDDVRAMVRDRGGVITTAELVAAGMSRSALAWARRSGTLVPLRHGVHTSAELWEAASPRLRHLLVVLAWQRVRPELVACGSSAAALLKLPLPDGIPLVPRLTEARGKERLGAGGHRSGAIQRRSWLDGDEVRTARGGVRVTSLLRTVLDCARTMDPLWGLAVADAALTRHWFTAEELSAAAAARPPSPGSQRVTWVAGQARDGVESPLESLARGVVVRAGLPEPTPQVRLDTRCGWFRVDLLDETNRVIIEADGRLKYVRAEDLWQEKRREDALRERGFEVVRFTMRDHHDPLPWLDSYRRALRRARGGVLPESA